MLSSDRASSKHITITTSTAGICSEVALHFALHMLCISGRKHDFRTLLVGKDGKKSEKS
jgi:hypothetical protein